MERSPGNPVEYPSLNDPYYRTVQYTPEEELAEALKDDPAMVHASMRIVAACGQLANTVNKPWHGLMDNLLGSAFSSAIRFLEAAKIVEILREAGPGGLPGDPPLGADLRINSTTAAAADTAPLTPAYLSHILRLLATGHYLREVKPDVFANNRASSYIDSGKTLSQLREAPEQKYNDTDGIAATLPQVTGDETAKLIACLTDWALPKAQHSPLAGRGADAHFDVRAPAPPDNQEAGAARDAAPFNLAFNTQLDFFTWLEQPGNEARRVRFGHAMRGTRQCEIKHEILRGFPWEELPHGSVVVDVGGGIGAQSIVIADAHAHIRVVVEDREQVVSSASSAWGPQYAHLFDSGRMSWRARDFFEAWTPLTLPGQEPADAPDVFLLRSILHDWKDEDCKRILTQLRAAAGPHTKLLIGDMLLQHACADEAAYDGSGPATFPFVTKDSPLLPNLGVANILGYLTDLLVMGVSGAKERTEGEMAALLLSAGWKVVEIRRMPGSMWGYTTAVPV